MKNESRTEELLAESLKRQDQMVEEIHQLHGGIKEMRGDIKEMRIDVNRMANAVNILVDIVQEAMNQLKEIPKIKDRLDKLERHTGLS